MTKDLDTALEKFLGNDDPSSVVVAVSRTTDPTTTPFSWIGGELGAEERATTPFFIASTTKLYTNAMIFQLCDQGRLGLDDRMVDVLPGVTRLHRGRSGVDATAQITVRHLVAHTSGLPDYFQGKPPRGTGQNRRSLEDELRAGNDRSWTFEEALSQTAAMPAPFFPGPKRRALYSDTNHQVLGRIVEVVTGSTFVDAMDNMICQTLHLSNTWMYADPADHRPVPLRDGAGVLDIPLAMTSFGPDGGVVADVTDLMTFIRAFFEGALFDPSWMTIMKSDSRRINFPLKAGPGVIRFGMPRVLTPVSPRVDLIGHSGLSGAFAFLAPDHGLYFAGTVNNLAKPQRAYQLMVRLLNAAAERH